jgi:hypothetical protein
MWSAMPSAAAWTKRRSGVLLASKGVGTQTKIASHSGTTS